MTIHKTITRPNIWVIASGAIILSPLLLVAAQVSRPPLPQYGYKPSTIDAAPAAAQYGRRPSTADAAATAVTPQSVVDEHEVDMRWACEDSIKSQLRDPRSYEVEKVSYLPSAENSSGAIVSTVIAFRSRNGFGGMAPAVAACGFDGSGALVSAAAIASP